MCVVLSVLSFIEIPVGTDFKTLFEKKDDAMNSSITLIFVLLVVVSPYIGYIGIKNNFKNLQSKSVKFKYGVFYEDNRTNTLVRAHYNIYFLTRRFCSVMVLVFMLKWPFF